MKICAAFILSSMALIASAHATFHEMQIEQIVGGVNGDTSAQAMQLRMRNPDENMVAGAQLVAFDAAGKNPVVLITFPSNVSVAATGARILITTSTFNSHLANPVAPDFIMSNAIPASYLPAGRVVYQSAGELLWSLSWGGSAYTGSNLGENRNDNDGNFGPPFPGPLPFNTSVALRFTGTASAPSTNNAANYQRTNGAATFINNSGLSEALPAQLLNIATRLPVQTGDNVLIGGFIVTGNAPKKVILRGIGPSLGQANINNPLANPRLELHDSSSTLAVNDNWRSDPQQATLIEASGIPPSNDLESAIVATLSPGSYTAVVAGQDGGTGIGVVEAYDLDPSVDSKLANLSTRGFVDVDDNVMIGGFTFGPGTGGGARLLVRGLGPSLTSSGITNPLGNPMLEIHNGNGATVVSNHDWKDTQAGDIAATGIPPANDSESAIVATLQPGPYTAILAGEGRTTGVGLVEVYNLP